MSGSRTSARMDEQLSAFLDGQLNSQERARLEARLASDPVLRERLEALRRTVGLVRAMPLVSAPRNFLLTPAMVAPNRARPAPRRWLVPALSFSTAVSGIFCMVALATVLLSSRQVSLPLGAAPAAPTSEVAMREVAPTEAPAEEAAAADLATEAPPAAERELPPPSEAVTESAELLQAAPTGALPSAPTGMDWTATYTTPPGIGGGEVPPAPLPLPTPTPKPTVVITTVPSVATAGQAEPPAAYATEPESQQVQAPSPLRWLLVVGLALFTLGLAAATVMAWRRGRQGDTGTR